MSTLLLSLLLIALIAVGIVMSANPIREMFANPTPYSAVGTGAASTIKGWGDLTPTETAFIKNSRVFRNTKFNKKIDVNGPLDSNDRANITVFRNNASIIQKNMAKGDYSVAGPNQLTIEEFKEFMDVRNVQGVSEGAPMTPQEIKKISDRRRAFAAPAKPAAPAKQPAKPVTKPVTKQVNTLERGKAVQSATTVGKLTPEESNFIKFLRANKIEGGVIIPPSAPISDKENMIIVMQRNASTDRAKRIASGNYAVTPTTLLTISEYNVIAAAQAVAGIPPGSDLTDTDRAKLSTQRAIEGGQGTVTSVFGSGKGSIFGSSGTLIPMSGSGSSTSLGAVPTVDPVTGLVLSTDETTAVLQMRKKADLQRARDLLDLNSNPTVSRTMSDKDYDDDYSGYESVSPSQRRRMRRRDHEEDEPECPDMSQYVKLDEVPCWNCSLP